MSIILHPDKRLRAKCSKVKKIDSYVRKHAKLLMSELKEIDHPLAFVGGIAANQVGIDKRIIILKTLRRRFVTMINPEIISSWITFLSLDMCASVPKSLRVNKRKLIVNVKYLGLDNQEHTKILFGSSAFTLQQEVDHLDGKLIID